MQTLLRTPMREMTVEVPVRMEDGSMRVFSWQESSTTYFWRDVAVGAWPNDRLNLVSMTPDKQNWLSKLESHGVFFIAGATRVVTSKSNQIWLGWTAAKGNNVAEPYVQMIVLDTPGLLNPRYELG